MTRVSDLGYFLKKYRELLQPFNCNHFSKISRIFYASRKLWIIVVFLQCTLYEKLPLFLENTLLLYIPLLALTDRQNHRGTNTLASRGLEELFLQLCCCDSFWFWRGIGFGLYTYVFRVQYSCGVVLVFGSGGKYFFVFVSTYLVYDTVVRLC